MTAERFHYRAFGLDIDSELEIAQLQIGDADQADPDRKLILQLGEVEEKTISAPGLRRGLVRTQFRYEVVNGRHVTIECLPGADRRDVTDMIAGRVMTSVMYQRGLLPLHASAVSIGGGIVALCGESGTGKSTLAAALGRNGHVVVSDDLLPVRASAGQIPRAWPGASRLKLSQAALDYLGYTDDNLPLVNSQEENFLADQAPLGSSEKSELWRDGQSLKAIIRIKRGPLAIRNLRPLEAMADWPLHMRSTDLVPVADPPDAIWQQWLNIVKQVPMLELSCSGEFSELLETAKRIEKYLAAGQ
jgi:hypothetical protein